MPNHAPYLVLVNPESLRRSFAYYADRKGIVTVRCVDPALLGPLGPWLRPTADRHASTLVAAGYLAFIPGNFATQPAATTPTPVAAPAA
jgi:hypothetical protein